MSMNDILKELSDKIGEVYDLEVAKDLTEIYEALADRACAGSRKYWQLVKKLAAVERERDPLANEIGILLEDDLPLD